MIDGKHKKSDHEWWMEIEYTGGQTEERKEVEVIEAIKLIKWKKVWLSGLHVHTNWILFLFGLDGLCPEVSPTLSSHNHNSARKVLLLKFGVLIWINSPETTNLKTSHYKCHGATERATPTPHQSQWETSWGSRCLDKTAKKSSLI